MDDWDNVCCIPQVGSELQNISIADSANGSPVLTDATVSMTRYEDCCMSPSERLISVLKRDGDFLTDAFLGEGGKVVLFA